MSARVADEKRHRILLIEDHLGFEPVPTFRLIAELSMLTPSGTAVRKQFDKRSANSRGPELTEN